MPQGLMSPANYQCVFLHLLGDIQGQEWLDAWQGDAQRQHGTQGSGGTPTVSFENPAVDGDQGIYRTHATTR